MAGTVLSFAHTAAAAAKSLRLCLTLCDPRDGSPPGSAVPGILQARALEWAAIAFRLTSLILAIILETGIAISVLNMRK